ncbi:Biopolymer transport protein ExbB/TolQ [Devosia lucknowensis]|uniref:Biopolymer transport protein ExbB/TolQ n=1 Tax=Devosia lucknowensis TaxID=1096929 RepID=A0A1Y6FKQ2_9HYPH|nr:flagellar motor protein MotA [Devosia lucknowensis]SMQ73023.1 Biopolymer transport protein ExbB/TolQ [Devosia lucknowensis]
MTQTYDPYHLASPTVYLVKIIIFLVLVGLVAAILFTNIVTFFWANPFINSMIFFALFIGIFLSFRQIFRLFPEVKWVNSLQDGSVSSTRPPVLLAPVAGLLRERIGEAVITPSSMRSILDSVGNRLDEAKDTSRYLTGLLVFLGLMGTFYGLLETVGSVAGVINALDVTSADSAALFSNLKEGLAAPLGGMGTAFSSSLFGLAGSLVLGFLDLQTSQAQNAFYTDLEDWMTSMTELDHPVSAMQANAGGPDMTAAIERLGANMQNQNSSQNAIRAMAELARGIDGLVKHIRTEQDDLRKYITEQGETNKKLRDLIEAMLNEADNERRN